MNRFETLIEQCDADIRQGRPFEAAKRLAPLKGARVPNAFRLPLAKICRRAGLLTMGLRLLARMVDSQVQGQNLEAERAEYAVLLLRAGVVNEALDRLTRIDAQKVPEALLYRAYAHFALWEFSEAIPLLKQYCRADLSESALLVGRTNLAFAQVECRTHDEALLNLAENIDLAQRIGHAQLEDYNRAVRAQVDLQEGNFAQARDQIEQARTHVSSTQNNDQFFITKLDLITKGLSSGDLAPFQELREKARAKRDWFSLRDADFYSLKVKFEHERFMHLYFGSPFEGFRALLRNETGVSPDTNHYILGGTGLSGNMNMKVPCFDLNTGTLDGADLIGAGGKIHQVLEALLRDFYQPSRIATLHSILFQGERFNINSSPDRIRQLLRRSRAWIREAKLPISIKEDSGFYSLVIEGGFSFRISLDRATVDLNHLRLSELKKCFAPGALFSTRDLRKKMHLSQTSAHRLLKRALETGEIERLGPVKRPTGYRVVRPLKNAI